MKGDTIHLLTAPSGQQKRRYFHVKSVLDPGSAARDLGLNLFGIWVWGVWVWLGSELRVSGFWSRVSFLEGQKGLVAGPGFRVPSTWFARTATHSLPHTHPWS